MRLDPRIFVIVAIQSYEYVLFARIILSWFPLTPPDAIRPAFNFLYDVTEPFLRIFRRLLPPIRMGTMAMDLSPLIAFVVLRIIESVAIRTLLALPG